MEARKNTLLLRKIAARHIGNLGYQIERPGAGVTKQELRAKPIPDQTRTQAEPERLDS
jgi:hypothetical protein